MVSSAAAFPKVTVPGPERCVHAVLRVPGRPVASTVAVRRSVLPVAPIEIRLLDGLVIATDGLGWIRSPVRVPVPV